MPRYAPNKMPATVKRQYFSLIRAGLSGSAAAQEVGVSLSCGSVCFIDAGGVNFIETPISARYLSQDDRIEISDGLARGERIKVIAARIGKSYQTVYREVARNRKPDGSYQPWYAHNQAYLRRRRPKPRRLENDSGLRDVILGKLAERWSPAQISRWLRRRYHTSSCLARVLGDHLPGSLSWGARPRSPSEPAYRSNLPPPTGPRPIPRRRVEAVHGDALYSPAAGRGQLAALGRALGGRSFGGGESAIGDRHPSEA